MSDQDFVIVDEEKDSEIPQEKENRTEDSRKEVVKDAERSVRMMTVTRRSALSVTDRRV